MLVQTSLASRQRLIVRNSSSPDLSTGSHVMSHVFILRLRNGCPFDMFLLETALESRPLARLRIIQTC